MNFETRALRAAERLQTAADVDVDVDARLARLRRTHRHRNTIRVAGAALAVACVVGGSALVLDGNDRAAPPADQGPVDNPVSPSTAPASACRWSSSTGCSCWSARSSTPAAGSVR